AFSAVLSVVVLGGRGHTAVGRAHRCELVRGRVVRADVLGVCCGVRVDSRSGVRTVRGVPRNRLSGPRVDSGEYVRLFAVRLGPLAILLQGNACTSGVEKPGLRRQRYGW